MTLLMVWTNKPDDATAINIAADSLLSDPTRAASVNWPYATKIHRLHPTREYFGYCGDSFVGLSAIAAALAAISNSDHLSETDGSNTPTIQARVKAVHEHLRHTFPLIPPEWNKSATLILVGYDLRKERFSAWELVLSQAGVADPVEVVLTSKRVHCFGTTSGAEFKISQLEKTGNLSTASIVEVLVDVIRDSSVPAVGGAPQMVMLTKQQDLPVGFWWPGAGEAETRHLFGVPIRLMSKMDHIKWVTSQFEDRPYTPFKRVEGQ